MTSVRRSRAASPCAEIDTPECRDWIASEALRLRAAGDSRAARRIALDVCEEVWLRTGSRRTADAAYRDALRIARRALSGSPSWSWA